MYVSTVLLLLSVFQVSTLVENNERIYDTRHGGFVQFKDRQGKIFSLDNIDPHKQVFHMRDTHSPLSQ